MIRVEFKSKTNKQFGLVVTRLTRRKRAEEHIEQYTVEGRSGRIVDRLGTFDSYEREVEFANFEPDERRDINKWLSGKGILRTSEDPGGFFFADIIDAMEREPLGCNRNILTAKMLVEPFFYLDTGEHIIETDKTLHLYNIGSIYAAPIIKVFGNGSGQISINDKIVYLRNISEHITIDGRLQIVHKDKLPQGKNMIGDYPIFEEGENIITFSGGITKLEITPYWREL